MRLLDGRVGDQGFESVVEGLLLWEGEGVAVEDIAELFEAEGLLALVFAELFRGEDGRIVDGRKVFGGAAEGGGVVALLDGAGETADVFEHPGLFDQAELGELVGDFLYRLYLDELEAVGQFLLAGEVQVLDEGLDVAGIEKGPGGKRGFVSGDGDAPAHDAGEDVFDGFGEDVQGKLLFFYLLYFLPVVVFFKALQRFFCCAGEAFKRFYEGVCHGCLGLVQEVCHFADHVVVDIAVAGKGTGAFAVAGELADEVGVFDLFI